MCVCVCSGALTQMFDFLLNANFVGQNNVLIFIYATSYILILLFNTLRSPYYGVTGSHWGKLSQKVNICSISNNVFFLGVTVTLKIIG